MDGMQTLRRHSYRITCHDKHCKGMLSGNTGLSWFTSFMALVENMHGNLLAVNEPVLHFTCSRITAWISRIELKQFAHMHTVYSTVMQIGLVKHKGHNYSCYNVNWKSESLALVTHSRFTQPQITSQVYTLLGHTDQVQGTHLPWISKFSHKTLI